MRNIRINNNLQTSSSNSDSAATLKVLYVKDRDRYINLTIDCFAKSLEKCFTVVYFMPSFSVSPSKTLQELDYLLDKHNFSAIFMDHHIVEFCCESAIQKILSIKLLHFVVGLRIDPYAFKEEDTIVTNADNLYYILHPYQTILPVSESEDIELEGFPCSQTDNFLNFCNKNKNRVIPIPHIIEIQQDLSVNNKKFISVPGTKYIWRRECVKMLANNKLYRDLHFAHKLINYLIFEPYTPKWLKEKFIKFSQNEFFKMLSYSRIAITDGSRLKHLVRKYFEIPQNRALLLCDPFHAYEDFGFEENKNFIRADMRNLSSQVDEIVKNYIDYHIVIENAYNLVKDNFSVDAIAKILGPLVKYLVEGGRFYKSFWENGYFCVDKI